MNPRIKRPPYPHVTLLAPFVAPEYFDEAQLKLREVAKNIEPFRLQFALFELFNNAHSSTLYLKPEIEVSVNIFCCC